MNTNLAAGAIIVGALGVIAVPIGFGMHYAYSTHEKTCTISGKEVVIRGHGQDVKHQMRVHTDDCGSFRVGDAWLKGEFSSSDTYGKLKEGHVYTLKYYGHRSGWRSAFPNIIEATEVR